MRRCLTFLLLTTALLPRAARADARFDLVGPRIDVRVTRAGDTLPIASVPNLQPGDKLWLHPDLPPTQSVKYLLICVFLRGTTNPPPDEWFTRIETWNRKVRTEGVFVTVPAEAEQAVLFLAPETGGDFSTLRSAVKGRPGVFVRASQDLAEAGFEQARIEKYLASIRRVPPSDASALQQHSDLLARTLALKPNPDCFKRPADTQFTCLTQTGTQTLLDDGHGQTLVAALANGQNADFINAASNTRLAGAGQYSAYVGAIVDLVRIMGSLHTAQFQYIPAIAFPQAESLNLRLNTPPSFHNPKSVLVIGLPAVQGATPPPLRSADANHVACLLEPSVVLPIEGAPLVFSTAFAHDLVLHLNTDPAQPDIHLTPDAFLGGLLLSAPSPQHTPLPSPPQRLDSLPKNSSLKPHVAEPNAQEQPSPARASQASLTGTILGRWGFDTFTGPTVPLQQLPGTGWHVVASPASTLIAGHETNLLLSSTGSACVHTITAAPPGTSTTLPLTFKPAPSPEEPNLLALKLPEGALAPGDLHLSIQQFGQPRADTVSTRTFSEPAQVSAVELHAADRNVTLRGQHLAEVEQLTLGDLHFTPAAATSASDATTLHLSLPSSAPAPPTHSGDHLSATLTLHDGRTFPLEVTVAPPRPAITLLHKSAELPTGSSITLTNPDDLPLSAHITFTLKTPSPFPRNGQVEIQTEDGTLRTVLTLAPSGGLLLQDTRTVVASLDPFRSFGPSAFGSLHLRAIYPTSRAEADADPADAPASDWLPLGTLVRLPILTQLQCPPDPVQPCTLTGSNLFLIAAVSSSPTFASPTPVPDGYTDPTLAVPHTTAGTVFLHLRDDPSSTASAILPASTPPQSPSVR